MDEDGAVTDEPRSDPSPATADDPSPTATATATSTAPTRDDQVSAAAIGRYRARMRPLRVVYAAAIVAIVVIALVLVKIAYSKGEISHVTLRTVPTAPPAVGVSAAVAPLKQAWASTDTTAIGMPFWKGTVISHDEHTVRGRNARTGAVTWSYTRTDRTVCSALSGYGAPVMNQPTPGLTIAVYELHGNCDELTGLDSSTGKRMWTRTLDENQAVFDGPATFSVETCGQNCPDQTYCTSGCSVFFFVSHTSIYALRNDGVDYWSFHHNGCRINSAVPGIAGVLISQDCAGEQCDGIDYCGDGQQLLLRDQQAGYDDMVKSTRNKDLSNADRIIWNTIGSVLVPTDAANTVAARPAGGGTLDILSPTTGKILGRRRLGPNSGSGARSAVTELANADLVWIGGRAYAVAAGSHAVLWRRQTRAVPTVVGGQFGVAPRLARARLTVATGTGVATLDPGTGAPATRYAVAATPAASLVFPLGTGFVVAGPHTTVFT